MSSILQQAMRQLQDEHTRLNTFVKTYTLQDINTARSERARLLSPNLIIGTENHGYFVLDESEVLEIMNNRRDKLAAELKQYTALGERLPQT